MRKFKPRTDQILLGSIVVLQLVFSGFFIFDLGSEVMGWRAVPMSWEFHEAVQLITIAALLLGAILGLIAFRNLARQRREMARQLLIARNAFHELIQQSFIEWGLTPSEREVGLFVLKGLSNAEIAEVRGKSIGTVKAQVNAVFRKAGANGRTQFITLFMEELIAD
jgi:DNA-binding CsgD family transcriptional regulator